MRYGKIPPRFSGLSRLLFIKIQEIDATYDNHSRFLWKRKTRDLFLHLGLPHSGYRGRVFLTRVDGSDTDNGNDSEKDGKGGF